MATTVLGSEYSREHDRRGPYPFHKYSSAYASQHFPSQQGKINKEIPDSKCKGTKMESDGASGQG